MPYDALLCWAVAAASVWLAVYYGDTWANIVIMLFCSVMFIIFGTAFLLGLAGELVSIWFETLSLAMLSIIVLGRKSSGTMAFSLGREYFPFAIMMLSSLVIMKHWKKR